MLTNLRVYLTNISALFFTLTDISNFLKILLLIVSIAFTMQRIYVTYIDRKEKKLRK